MLPRKMLAALLMGTAGALAVPSMAFAASPATGGVVLLDDAECWKRMPPTEGGGGRPLPSWAKALAGPLPRSTAALLRLDLVQRTRSPLDPKLRSRMRWVAAHANRCDYAEAYAEFDGRRAGLDSGAIEAMRKGDYTEDTPADRAALEFARKMTVDSASVTDAEFAALLQAHGEKRVVAMVLLLAYANFQDRLLLCLGSPLEPGGPRPPIDVTFAPGALTSRPGQKPPGQSRPLAEAVGTDLIDDDPDWAKITYEDLQARLESQRRRTTRIRVPSWDEVKRGLPPEEAATLKPSRVLWSLVTLGHQPELAIAWKTCMSTFLSEMKIDLTFEEGIFWVTTRAIECSYCMGHVEMGWELAGLTLPEISTRSRLLAGNDWSSFPPEEQRAYAFTRKLNKSPWAVSRADIAQLDRDFGPDRAASVIWAACRGHYMTRVSNGFQLSLERGNVFRNYFQEPTAGRPGGKP